jgi:hypothetical protein
MIHRRLTEYDLDSWQSSIQVAKQTTEFYFHSRNKLAD